MWSGDLRSVGSWGGGGGAGGGGVGTILLLLLCKEVSVLQQDCVYIESYIMVQLYAKLLLKFSFVWEFCCARLLISVYCCFLSPPPLPPPTPFSLTDEVSQLSFCVFFVLNSPQSQHHNCLLFFASALRVGGPLKHLSLWKHLTKQRGEQSTTLLHSCQFWLYPSTSSRWQLFLLYLTKFLLAKKNCVVFSLLTNFHVVQQSSLPRQNFFKNNLK